MAAVNWKRSELSMFIALYQECENLYNFNHPDYQNKKKRFESLNYICKKLEKLNKHVTINEIKQKIRTLRSQYAAVKKAEMLKHNGSTSDNDFYIPKLWCYDQLYFLDDFLKNNQQSQEESIPSLSPTPSTSQAKQIDTITDEQLMDILEDTGEPIITETLFIEKQPLANNNNSINSSTGNNSPGMKTNNIPLSTTATIVKPTVNNTKRNIQFTNLSQKQLTDYALAEFIYSNNIPFDIVESARFRKFVQGLDKSYVIPKKKQLLTTILDETYEQCQYENNSEEEKNAILMLCGLSDPNENMRFIFACIQIDDDSRHFLNLWDVEVQDSPLDFINEVLVECQEMARNLYNARIYMILSDDPELEIQQPVWHAVCNAPIVEFFTYHILDLDVVENIVKILRVIEKLSKEEIFKPNCPIILPVEKNWSTFRDTFRSYLKNFEDIRTLIDSNNELFGEELTELLFSEAFLKQVQKNFKLLISLTDLITISQKGQSTLAEVANAWLTLNIIPEFSEQLDTFRTNALSVYALAANYLHPKYRGKHLTIAQKEIVDEFLEEMLEDTSDLNAYRENKGIFKLLAERNVSSAKTFWSMAEKRHPELKKLAIKLLMNPASTFEIDKWFAKFISVHGDIRNTLGLERFRKLATVYFTFKFQEQNVKSFDAREGQ